MGACLCTHEYDEDALDLFAGNNVGTPPYTKKETTRGVRLNMKYGVSAMQGWRDEMEDAHIVAETPRGAEDHTIFAVFDGHGGDRLARYAAKHLVNVLGKTPEWDDYLASKDPEVAGRALQVCFLQLDTDARKKISDKSGCTAVVTLVTPDHVVCANAGDSRAFLKSSGALRPSPLSEDHKPSNPAEAKRIRAAKGYVQQHRVNGLLAVSRALGDFEFKQSKTKPPEEQQVSPFPDIEIQLIRGVDYIVLACDGIFDVLTTDDCARAVQRYRDEGNDEAKVCELMLDKCLAKKSTDNMSIILVTFAEELKSESLNGPPNGT